MLLSLGFVVALSAAALMAYAAWAAYEVTLGRRDTRPTSVALVRSGFLVAVVVLTLLAGLDEVNRRYSYVPTFGALVGDVSHDLHRSRSLPAAPARLTTAPRPLPANGQVVKLSVAGPVSGIAQRDTFVYLPPEYFDPAHPHERFPVLYLLHGSPGISLDWLRGGFVDRAMDGLRAGARIHPFLVVLPDYNGGYGRDAECEDVVRGPQVQTYLTVDVVGAIDGAFRTIPDRSARAIGGLSTGGYCALNIGLRHQDEFSAIVSHSGYTRPDVNRYTGNLFGGSAALRRANTPTSYAPTMPIVEPLGVYLDVGAGDRRSRTQDDAIVRVLRARGIDVTYNVFPGQAHSWSAWRQNILVSLPWVSGWFTSRGGVA
jgi:enterochelin esterase-like enzyme